MNSVNWDLVRSFLLVAQHGSLTSAARKLGVSQPTLTRNIQSLEQQTRLQLFERTTKGLALTEAGEKLVDAATSMEVGADQFDRQVSGLSVELKGDVRISVNEVVGIYLLPPAITAFRHQHPGVDIEVEISNETVSLNKRDADIALRMYRPSQPDLVARRLPDMAIGFYATQGYLEKRNIPNDLGDLKHHHVIGYDRNTEFIEGANKLGYNYSPNDFCIRTDNLLLQIALAKSGAGIAVTHIGLAKHWPELKRVLSQIPVPPLEFWIVCHSDTQYNSRIQALTKFLIQWFKDDAYRLE